MSRAYLCGVDSLSIVAEESQSNLRLNFMKFSTLLPSTVVTKLSDGSMSLHEKICIGQARKTVIKMYANLQLVLSSLWQISSWHAKKLIKPF